MARTTGSRTVQAVTRERDRETAKNSKSYGAGIV